MSSRSGPRAAGTDGNDYSHREIIKEQYYISQNGVGGAGGGGGGRDFRYAQQPQQQQQHGGHQKQPVRNTDPGVWEPEDEEDPRFDAGFTRYADEGEFFQELTDSRAQLMQQEQQQQEQVASTESGGLPLSGDYRGMGGPNSVPLSAPGSAFDRPASLPHSKCLLDDLFMAPNKSQLDTYQKTMMRKNIAQNKSRLKWSVFAHYVAFLILAVKLSPEILDRFDVFILELEELYIPKPILWEWIWLASALFTYFGLTACKKSNASSMTIFIYGVLLTGLLPVLFALTYHAKDVFGYVSSKSLKGVQSWQGFPVALLWYAFLVLAFQVHMFELYFARTLVAAWLPKRKAQ